jgi:phosphoglycolate phosphatase
VLVFARETGRYDDLDRLLTAHENRGAESAQERPLLASLDGLDYPVGICTANARSAAERALERHGVRDAVEVVVARNAVTEGKPHPRPLRRCLDALGAAPGNAVFVGDRRSDAEAAVAVGTSFLHPAQFAAGTRD